MRSGIQAVLNFVKTAQKYMNLHGKAWFSIQLLAHQDNKHKMNMAKLKNWNVNPKEYGGSCTQGVRSGRRVCCHRLHQFSPRHHPVVSFHHWTSEDWEAGLLELRGRF